MKRAARTACHPSDARMFSPRHARPLFDLPLSACYRQAIYYGGFCVRKIGMIFMVVAGLNAVADEGMWTLNGFPTKAVAKKYHFTATPAWLEHVRLSSARLAFGCSGSFVSQNGLVMTNHHCARECIEQNSKAGNDHIANGFYATAQKDEVKCPEVEVNKLTKITDVTARIEKETKGLKGKDYNDKLKATMSTLEKECSGGSDETRCDVVTLYHGGKYHLYKYHRYQDVRLVFAPEEPVAFFGGDPDNFNFPRYDLDVSFMRVYDHGQPLQTKDYFQWSKNGSKEGDLTFVTGHPGHTSRLMTVSELEFIRDLRLPTSIQYASELRGLLTEFQKRGTEEKRISSALLFEIENWLKAMRGQHSALLDKSFFAKKTTAENQLRKMVAANPKWKRDYGSAWPEITKAYDEYRKIYVPYRQIEMNTYESKLYMHAKMLVRAAGELPKANEKRYREFADSNLPHMKQELFSEAPIYDELEKEMLAFHLTKMRENLLADHPFVKKVLGQKSPEELAAELVKGTRLKDVKYRKSLLEGGMKAVQASDDPMIQLALLMDPDARDIRKKYEDEIEPKIKQNHEKVAKAQFAVFGADTYPDATFTLRIAMGTVKGWDENGAPVPPFTTMGGAFERHTGREPFALPKSWLNAKSKLNLESHLNFSSTNDIIGGNSGSPVINKDAEIVGLIFDGNIHSLGNDFGFDEKVSRAVAVDSGALLESLEKIYGADRIIQDIRGTPAGRAGNR